MNTLQISKRIYELTNRRRLDNNLPPLINDNILNNSALLHSEYMRKYEFFSHENHTNRLLFSPKKRIQYCGGSYIYYGENIAMFPIYKSTRQHFLEILTTRIKIYQGNDCLNVNEFANEVVKGWMESPGHRRNILNVHYNQLGIGTLLTNKNIKGHNVVYGIITKNFGGY